MLSRELTSSPRTLKDSVWLSDWGRFEGKAWVICQSSRSLACLRAHPSEHIAGLWDANALSQGTKWVDREALCSVTTCCRRGTNVVPTGREITFHRTFRRE